MRYHLAPAHPDLVAGVSFKVSPPRSQLRLRLDTVGPWRECAVPDGRASCDLWRAPPALAPAGVLAVSAR